jgi:Uncharacterised protein conserved in bacteria (DUF2336)
MKTAVKDLYRGKIRFLSRIPQFGGRPGREKTETISDTRMASSPYEKLLELAHQRALKGKGGLAASVAEMCLASKSSLSGRELALAFEILRLLVDKVEVNIRRHIADYLADRHDAPRDLIRRLAKEEIAVAYPILAHNTVLDTEDLVEIVDSCSIRHRQAIAIRPDISQAVTDRLVAFDEIEVMTTLLCNETADIGEASMRHLVERSLEIESFREPLAHRKEMTGDMARRMYIWAGDSLREFIVDSFDVNPAAFEVGSDNVAQGGFGIGGDSPDDHSGNNFAFLAFLDAGDYDGFERAFAEALKLPQPAMTMILHDSGPETVAIASKAAGIGQHAFGEILCHLSGADPASAFKSTKEFRRAVRYFAQLDHAGAMALLDRLRTTPGQRRRA